MAPDVLVHDRSEFHSIDSPQSSQDGEAFLHNDSGHPARAVDFPLHNARLACAGAPHCYARCLQCPTRAAKEMERLLRVIRRFVEVINPFAQSLDLVFCEHVIREQAAAHNDRDDSPHIHFFYSNVEKQAPAYYPNVSSYKML